MRVLGQPIITDAPLSLLQPTIDGILAVTLTVTAGAISAFTASGLAAQAGISAVWEGTKPFANNKTNFKTDYRQFALLATAASPDLEATYVSVFGATADVGNIVSLRLSYIDTTNGMRSPYLITNAIAVAA
jgi:hypothetical protein